MLPYAWDQANRSSFRHWHLVPVSRPFSAPSVTNGKEVLLHVSEAPGCSLGMPSLTGTEPLGTLKLSSFVSCEPLTQGGEAEAEAELQTRSPPHPTPHACGCHGCFQASGTHRKQGCGLCAEARMAKVKDRDCFK